MSRRVGSRTVLNELGWPGTQVRRPKSEGRKKAAIRILKDARRATLRRLVPSRFDKNSLAVLNRGTRGIRGEGKRHNLISAHSAVFFWFICRCFDHIRSSAVGLLSVFDLRASDLGQNTRTHLINRSPSGPHPFLRRKADGSASRPYLRMARVGAYEMSPGVAALR